MGPRWVVSSKCLLGRDAECVPDSRRARKDLRPSEDAGLGSLTEVSGFVFRQVVDGSG